VAVGRTVCRQSVAQPQTGQPAAKGVELWKKPASKSVGAAGVEVPARTRLLPREAFAPKLGAKYFRGLGRVEAVVLSGGCVVGETPSGFSSQDHIALRSETGKDLCTWSWKYTCVDATEAFWEVKIWASKVRLLRQNGLMPVVNGR